MPDERPIVTQLFESIGVKRVVYVDDRFGITRERIIAACRNLAVEQITASKVFPNLEIPEDEAIREERLTKAIDVIPIESLQSSFDAIQDAAGIGLAEQDRLAAKVFSETLGASAEIIQLSLSEWQSLSADLIQEAERNPTLFIFDDDFQLEGGAADEGRRLILELHNKLKNYKYAFALLTHNATTDQAETDIETAIAEAQPEIQDFVVVIAKARLTGEDRDRFVQRLKSTLLFRLFRSLRIKLREAETAAHTKAIDKIESLGVDAFERIIHRSSQAEGAWSPETLVRIFGVIHDREVRSLLRRDEGLHGSVLGIDPLCAVETGGVSEAVQKVAEELQRGETYDSEVDLNALHLPIDCGDIFRTDAGDLYVLVAQACDLSVRSDGRRRKDLREERQMAALIKLGFRRRKKDSRFSEHEFELCHYDDTLANDWFCEVNQTVDIPVWILDLCVLNSSGNCQIKSDEQAAPLLTSFWRKRLDILKERAEKVVTLSDLASLPEGDNKDELLRSLLRLPLSTNFSVKIGPSERQSGQAWQLEVGIRRVLRVRERYAAALLGHYANYISRPGQPHDLTNVG